MSLFPDSYSASRRTFRQKAMDGGFELTSLPLGGRGEEGEDLTIEVAVRRGEDPSSVILHLTGVHGVEGYAGAAVQFAIFDQLHRQLREQDRPRATIVLVHPINPHGMSWVRRVNGANVDLNRNYRSPAEIPLSLDPRYLLFDRFLNPKSVFDVRFGFVPAILARLRLGQALTLQIVARGQALRPQGLFFTGEEVQPELRALQTFLATRFFEAAKVWVLDVHTGLGAWGGELLMVDPEDGAESEALLSRTFGTRVLGADPSQGIYDSIGKFSQALREALPAARFHYAMQEFGTYPTKVTLKALRRENRAVQYGGREIHRTEVVKREMFEAFCPGDTGWRQKVVQLGVQRFFEVFRGAEAAEVFPHVSPQAN